MDNIFVSVFTKLVISKHNTMQKKNYHLLVPYLQILCTHAPSTSYTIQIHKHQHIEKDFGFSDLHEKIKILDFYYLFQT